MSAWRRRLKSLQELGPGQHPSNKFDMLDQCLGSARTALQQLVLGGYAQRHIPENKATKGYTYSITKLGLDVVEGRVEIRHKCLAGGSKCRTKCIPTATWLRALPRHNEITL